MKRTSLLISILVLAVAGVFADPVKDYCDTKMREMMFASLREEGHFLFSFVPNPLEPLVLQNYPTWVQKRYNEERRVQETKVLIEEMKGKIWGIFWVSFKGAWDSKGQTELKIPDDFQEYLFIENEKGDYWPCTKADIPFMGNTINLVNEDTTIMLEFPFPDELAAGGKVIFSIGGFDLENTTFVYELPFSDLFVDAPEEMKTLFYKAGIWTK